jgi:hypothetical protein
MKPSWYRLIATYGAFTSIVFLILMSDSHAWAATDLELLLAVTTSNQSVTTTNPAVSGLTIGSRGGYSFGLLANIPLSNPMWSIGTGVLYTEMGSHQKFTNAGAPFDYDEKVPYWQIPVMANAWFAPWIGVGAGGYYAFAGSNVSDQGIVLGFPYSASMSFNSAGYTSSDYGVMARLQLRYRFGAQWFASANAMYELGLANVSNNALSTVKNSTLIYGLGIGATL